jgi:uncharacterized OB-fold protein
MSAPVEPLLPPIHEDAVPFWEGARAGELRIPRCPETGRLFFPPRPASPFAPHRAPEWATVSGRGTIWSFIVPHPPLLPWYAERAPYPVIAVAIDEEPTVRLIGNLVTRPGGPIDEVDPATIEIGAPVRVVFESLSDEIALPRWMPA